MTDEKQIAEAVSAEPDTTVPEIDNEPVVAEKPEAEKPEAEAKTVPLAALHEERKRRQERDREVADLRQKWELGNKRLEELAKRFEKQPDPVPDYEQDPVGYIKHTAETNAKTVQELNQRMQEYAAQQQQREQLHAFKSNYEAQANAFKQKQQDFNDAYAHWNAARVERLAEIGLGEQEIMQRAAYEEAELAIRAMQTGANPAELIYKDAQRLGYRAKTKDNPIVNLQKGQKAASPLSSAGGKASKNISLESLSEMSDEEFSKLSDAEFRKAFGE